MRRLLIGMVAAVLADTVCVSGQELVFEVTKDTTIYSADYPIKYVFPNPEFLPATMLFPGQPYFAYMKKDSTAFDIFSYGGKIGTFIIPSKMKQVAWGGLTLSQRFIDNDDGWEGLYRNNSTFNVVDDNGTIVWTYTDTNFRICQPFLGFDGNNTYVCLHRQDFGAEFFKAWRFRTNISSASSPRTLAKSAASGPLPMMTFGATGEYRVSLQPAGGGKTSMQLFDMLGRTIFTKTIDDVTRPVTFTVPENSVPSTPFIAKFQDVNGSTLRKEIPVR